MSEPFLSLHKKGREDLQQQHYSLQQNQVLIAPSYIAAKVFWGRMITALVVLEKLKKRVVSSLGLEPPKWAKTPI